MKSYLSYQMKYSTWRVDYRIAAAFLFSGVLYARTSKQACCLPSILHSANQVCKALSCLLSDTALQHLGSSSKYSFSLPDLWPFMSRH